MPPTTFPSEKTGAEQFSLPDTLASAHAADPQPSDELLPWGDLATLGLNQLLAEDFQRSWKPLAGIPYRVQQHVIRQQRVIQFEGTALCTANWQQTNCWRMVPFDVHECWLLFRSAEETIGFYWHRQREPAMWAVYRLPNQPKQFSEEVIPTGTLLATDSGHAAVSGVAILDWQYENERLALCIAGVPLISVPLRGTLQAVVLGGRFHLRGMAWERAASPPEMFTLPIPEVRPVSFQVLSPPEPIPTLSTAIVEQRHAEPGTGWENVSWTFPAANQQRRLTWSVGTRWSPCLEMHIQRADPGVGVFLGDARGEPWACLHVSFDRRRQRPVLLLQRPQELAVEVARDPWEPLLTPIPELRLRLVAGLGQVRLWWSLDGSSWSQSYGYTLYDIDRPLACFGVYSLPTSQPTQLAVSGWLVRSMVWHAERNQPDLEQLAQETAAGMRETNAERHWWSGLCAALETKPSTITLAEWWKLVAAELLPGLSGRAEIETCLAGLREAIVESLEPRVGHSWVVQVLSSFNPREERELEVWARTLASRSFPDDRLQLPISWGWWLRAGWFLPRGAVGVWHEACERALLHAWLQHDWEHVSRLVAWGLHLTQTGHPDQQLTPAAQRLLTTSLWCRHSLATMRRQAERPEVISQELGPNPITRATLPPYKPEYSREIYNTWREWQVALADGRASEAASILRTLPSLDETAVVPDQQDPALSLALFEAFTQSLQQYPEVARQLPMWNEAYAHLQIQEAMRRGTETELWRSALCATGTSVAPLAWMTLADRALSRGEPTSALTFYRRAWSTADATQRQLLWPRYELTRRWVEALEGMTIASPDQDEKRDALQLEGIPLEAWLARQQRMHPPFRRVTALSEELPVLEPRDYTWHVVTRFDGQTGQDAGHQIFRTSDLLGRQLSVLVHEQRCYLHNRFQLSVYDTSREMWMWGTAIGSEQGVAHAYVGLPFVPAVAPPYVFFRRITRTGTDLVCLNTDSGQLLWQQRLEGRGSWASDPLVFGRRIRLLAAIPDEQQQLELRWVTVDAEHGQILEQRNLLTLRDVGSQQLPVGICQHDMLIIAVMPGVVLAFGLTGEVHWIRQLEWLPAEVEAGRTLPVLDLPQISSGRLLLSLPGSRLLYCLDPHTGKVHWRHASVEYTGLLAVTSNIVWGADGRWVWGRDLSTGRILWKQARSPRLWARAQWSRGLVVAEYSRGQPPKQQVDLVWLEASQGKEVARLPLMTEERESWALGPLWSVDDQVWGLSAPARTEPWRDLGRLQPRDQFPLAASAHHGDVTWRLPFSSADLLAAQQVLPGWLPWCRERVALRQSTEHLRGQAPVLVSRVGSEDLLVWLRELTMAEDGDSPFVLTIRVGHQLGERWRLQVRLDQRLLVDRVVSEEHAAQGWLEERVILDPASPPGALLQVIQRSEQGKPAEGLWQKLSLHPLTSE
ncbi:MAG: hypothetical protein KatS3mg113_0492 [Planctomycetaceae bacterium]|nr:MAG: hypothetical protein KatS3mg113_0492 [Planctomycetaceae bacterium]